MYALNGKYKIIRRATSVNLFCNVDSEVICVKFANHSTKCVD